MEPCDLLSRERINLPDWIRETPSFAKEISDLFLQSRVVFYPGAGDDGHTIKLFGSSRAAFCFVYADTDDRGYGGHPTGYSPVLQEEVAWPVFDRPFNFNGRIPKRAQWTVFQRQGGYGPDHGHEFIALLYVYGEAFTVYWDLWTRNGKAPYAILIADHAMGGNFTGRRFGGNQSPMYEWANANNAWPDWLLVSELGSTEPWPGYHRVSTGDRGGMHQDERFLYRKFSRSTASASKLPKMARLSQF
jgi:hypothetical protein